MTDPLAQLSEAGVSVWLDDMSRERLTSGNLQQLIDTRSVVGVTTNPTIFQKAMSQGSAYDGQTRDLALRGVDVGEALRALTTFDVRAACDVLRPVFDASGGRDGRVSIEVDPRIAHETDRTIAEARALWWLVDRPNLFIKIPATVDGLPAITQCLSEGISVNVTLIFGLDRYDAVMAAFIEGVERRHSSGASLEHLESVASFFVSRVDTEIDKRLDKLGSEEAKALRGKAAVANARLAYQRFERAFDCERWRTLEAAGAKAQRPLWASTGVKDPQYSDTLYVDQLVAPGTVNTMPEATLDAVYDHAQVTGDTVRGRYDEAQQVLDQLGALGVDYGDVIDVLEREGVEKFEDSWNQLIEAVQEQLESFGAEVMPGGQTKPAGGGPGAASPETTSR
jgi:transaldolase